MTNRSGSYDAGAASTAGEAQRLRHQAAAIWGREWQALVLAGLASGARVLDVGCGPGGILERIGAGIDRTPFGVDVDQDFLRRARGGHVVRGDGAALPFADGAFDFVLFRLVLRHTPSRARLLTEAARVARAGGVVAAIDVDEGATSFDPEPPTWPDLRKALADSAIRRGGDPFVGRRLRRLLMEAGLPEAITAVLPVTTDDLSPGAFVETMLAPAARAVDSDLLAPEAVAAGWQALRDWAADGTGFGYAVGIMAAARKPNDWRSSALP